MKGQREQWWGGKGDGERQEGGRRSQIKEVVREGQSVSHL